MENSFKGKILVIGASAAGISAVKEIRKLNKKVDITVVTEETHFPYYRPFLTEYIGDKSVGGRSGFYLNKDSWYKENKINFFQREKVLEINTFNKSVKTNAGSEFTYDKLILANGSSPFVPMKGALEKENVFAVRTLDDAAAVEKYSDKAKRAVVIGGGLLGLEAADSLMKRGLEVVIVEFAKRLLPRQLDDEGSEILSKIVMDRGAVLRLGAGAESLEGEKIVTSVKLNTGETIETDIVIFSIGVRACTDLAEKCRLETNRGVVVNEKMETSEPDIYACGDVADFAGTPALWVPAIKQGRVAGINAIGGDEVFKSDKYPAVLNSFGTRIYSVGDICGGDNIENYITMMSIVPEKGIYKKLYFMNETLVGGILIGDISKSMAMLKGINSEIGVAEAAALLK